MAKTDTPREHRAARRTKSTPLAARRSAVKTEKPAATAASQSARVTYALKAYSAERRANGWYVSRTPLSVAGEKPEWSGPFQTIETAMLAIARRLATELADRHTRTIEARGIKAGDPMYGLKSTTALSGSKTGGAF